MVDPSKLCSHRSRWRSQIHFLLRLRIHESVSQEELLAFKIHIFLGEILPANRHGPEIPRRQPLLVLSQLPNEGYPDLQVWSTRVQKLQRLDHGPVVFAHEIGGQDAG